MNNKPTAGKKTELKGYTKELNEIVGYLMKPGNTKIGLEDLLRVELVYNHMTRVVVETEGEGEEKGVCDFSLSKEIFPSIKINLVEDQEA